MRILLVEDDPEISRLRNKLEDNPREPQIVVTVWGIGYKLGDVK